MTASRNISLCYRVANLVADEVRRLPMGVAARMLNTSKPMISRLRAGQLSSVPVLLKAIEQFGLRILEPVVGSVDTASLVRRLDSILAEVGDIRHVVSREATAAVLAHSDGVVGSAGRAGEGEAREAGEEGGHQVPRLAIIETRRHDGIPGAAGEALRRHLTGKVVSIDAARALVKGDNYGRTGLAYRNPGEDWEALVAPENRLWTPSPDPRPITDFAGNVVTLRRDLDEAARSTSPIFVSHAGALLREGTLIPFHSAVVRIGGRAKSGAEMVLTDFVRLRG